MAAGVYFLRWLGLRLWSRRGTLVFLLFWFGSWLLLNGVVLVHRRVLSDFCTDDRSKKILQRLVRNWLGLPEEEGNDEGGVASSLSKLWNGRLRSKDKTYSRAELASLWSLLQQEEYTFLRVLQDLSTHVAKVLGSCGHFYAVEYLSAGHAWDQNIFSLEEVVGSGSLAAWSARQKVHRIALSFLDMVHHFDNDFTHRVHLCDVKPENFAIRKDLTVVAIDVDMAFFEPKMEDILDQNCSSDDDCNFFDCSSSCNLMKRRCSRHRSNSNLQVICEKIFRLWFSPTLLGAKAGLPLQVSVRLTPSLPPKVLPHCSLPLVARSRWSFSGPCRNVPSPTAWAADKAGTSIGASWIS
ncbi:divergent protein kinase domain 1C isoform X5 [Nerophis lumbriciformis]|uniref:divergent protein kinase domain 1C isoform X5 n=1 Tax=Nerophis lumbriciformis TaxID=546530 RepID=UPI002ADF2EEC|nr:divergent protein kinase domain 1C isoform X5 [Nerophis lumbriciformis]